MTAPVLQAGRAREANSARRVVLRFRASVASLRRERATSSFPLICQTLGSTRPFLSHVFEFRYLSFTSLDDPLLSSLHSALSALFGLSSLHQLYVPVELSALAPHMHSLQFIVFYRLPFCWNPPRSVSSSSEDLGRDYGSMSADPVYKTQHRSRVREASSCTQSQEEV